ncbi:MAG TPA: nucleoside-diphosphate sugar epimerase/dehydratase [Thermoanaerobaculia bacterium]|nr:nucleoside-diphosphate sugar epimerase/dehydratase [Thermoanaerobaculia bacterium]
MSKTSTHWRITRGLQYTLDVTVLVLAFVFAYLLRFEFAVPDRELARAAQQLPYVVLIQFTALALAGVYSFIWRYVGMGEVKAFVYAGLWSGLALAVMRLSLPARFGEWRVPLSIILMGTILAFGGVVGLRVLRRYLYELSQRRERATVSSGSDVVPTLLVGAGRAGVLAAREIVGRGDMNLDVKGFIDDDVEKKGAVIHGIRVLGTTEDLPRLVKDLGIAQVVITIAQISRQEILRVIGLCRKIQVAVRIIPGLYEVLQGKVQVTRIRSVQIEDLLGREPVYLDEAQIGQCLAGKRVMVTGAGGSIGSELVRQIARFEPAKILLVERAEFALFEVDSELRRIRPETEIVPLVADVCDEGRMRAVFAEQAPQVVFHAAAHKHVPMMEANPGEAIKNNVLATRLVGELSGEYGVETFVMISTDKAVRPTSIMGATKRVAELAIQDLARSYRTRYLAVRFGNVVGSAGSVVPIFREQIRRGGPVTVTHPEMRRYFMTIPEAAQLVLQAGAIGEGGEIFILDMGEPVRILDLAEEMITLTGLRPYVDMDIVFTGLRPGEKLFEELELTGEEIAKTRHPKIFIGKLKTYPSEQITDALRFLEDLGRSGDGTAVRKFLNTLLPEASLGVRRTARESQPRVPTGEKPRLTPPYA